MQILKSFFAALVFTLAMQLAHGQDHSAEMTVVSREVMTQKAWLNDAGRCPSDVMPTREAVDHLIENTCKSPLLSACLARCKADDPGSCYWLGQALQEANADPRAYESLHQRACKLGVISGCTNRAAGMSSEKPDDAKTQVCASNTYAKACARDDPWACTMYALHLSRGIGVAQDLKLAEKVLEKSCRYGTEDQACQYGMQLKEELRKATGVVKKGK